MANERSVSLAIFCAIKLNKEIPIKTLTKKILSIILGVILIISLIGLTSCTPKKIPGLEGPYVVLQEDILIFSVIFTTIQTSIGGQFPISKYENSYLEISLDTQTGGTIIAYYISLQDIFGGKVDKLDPQKLPGGRPLPSGLGSLPASAFNVNLFGESTLYLGQNVFGIFIPSALVGSVIKNMIIPLPFKSGDKYIGNYYFVGSDSEEKNSGLLILLNLNSTTKNFLESVANEYR